MFKKIKTMVQVALVTRLNWFTSNGTFTSWDGSTERVLVSEGLVLWSDRQLGHYVQYENDIVLD